MGRDHGKRPAGRNGSNKRDRHGWSRPIWARARTSNLRAEVRRLPALLFSGEGALEGGAVGRPAMGREDVLDRQLEQRTQPGGNLLARYSGAEPALVDLEPAAEVDQRVAGDHRTLALDPVHGVVRLVPGEDVDAERQPVAGLYGRASPLFSRSSQTTSGAPSPACSTVRPYVSMRNC